MKRGVRDVAALLPPNAEQQFNRKGIIYDSNESCKRLYQVRWGRVMLSSGLHDGRPLATRIVGVNGLFGEGVLAAFPDHSESAVALDATCVFSWSRNEIEEIVNREPGIGLSLTAYFVKRCVELNTRLEDIAFRKTPERVLSSLLHLAETLGTPAGGGVRLAALTHQTLADYVGTSREIVTAHLTAFRRAGLLKYSRQHIDIDSAAVRKRLAGETKADSHTAAG